MEFRWVAGIALWTILSGPVLVGFQSYVPPGSSSKAQAVGLAWVRTARSSADHRNR
jgi:hypothetical protein